MGGNAPRPGDGVAGASRTAYAAMLLFFLGPAVAVYSLFSIYPLIATIGYSTFEIGEGGASSFAGLGNFRTLLFDDTWSKPFWNAFYNNCIFFLIHMLVQNPIGIVARGAVEPSEALRPRRLPHPHLHADHALGRHHRLHLAAHPVAAVGRRAGNARQASD